MGKVALIIFSLFLYATTTLACKVVTPKEGINLTSDLDQQVGFAYGERYTLPDTPDITALNCRDTAMKRKYLMIAVGPEIISIKDSMTSVSYNQNIFDDHCSLKNSPFAKVRTFAKDKENFLKRQKYLNKCTHVLVEHFSKQKFQYPKEQPGCTIKKINKTTITFQGGYCFFKPNFDSDYNIKLKIDESCLTREALKEKELGPMDFSAKINLFVAGDASGRSTDLTGLGSAKARISVNPVKELFAVSEDYGTLNPTWPAVYTAADIHFGNVTINKQGSRFYHLSTPIVVDNSCQSICKDGLCSSPCDYAAPTVAEMEITEVLESGKEEYIATWFDGGVAPAQWQGILNGIGVDLPAYSVKEGGHYRITATLYDPQVDFKMFKGRFLDKITPLHYNHPQIRLQDSTIGEISTIPTIGTEDSVPEIREIRGLRLRSSLDGVREALQNFGNYFQTFTWPPYFEKVCNDDYTNCKPLGKYVTKLTIDFQLGAYQKRTRTFPLEGIKIRRESPVVTNYEKSINQLPDMECK